MCVWKCVPMHTVLGNRAVSSSKPVFFELVGRCVLGRLEDVRQLFFFFANFVHNTLPVISILSLDAQFSIWTNCIVLQIAVRQAQCDELSAPLWPSAPVSVRARAYGMLGGC